MDVYVPEFTPREGFRNATRVHQALTAGVEKRILIWLAQRTPLSINSDHLTALGFASIVGAGAAFAIAKYDRRSLVAVCVLLALNWLGDSLDGTLARVRDQQRPRYGFYVDHVVDCLGSTALFAGIALSGFMSPVLALITIIAYLLLMAESFLATYTLGRFHMSRGFFGPTELRIVLAIGAWRLWSDPTLSLWGRDVLLFDVGGTIASAGMLAMLLVTAARHTAELFRQERLP